MKKDISEVCSIGSNGFNPLAVILKVQDELVKEYPERKESIKRTLKNRSKILSH